MKTLLLTRDFPPDLGGIARLYGELCRRFPAGGVEVMAPQPRGVRGRRVLRAAREELAPGVVVHRLPFTFKDAKLLTSIVRWTRWAERRVATGRYALIQAGNIRPTGPIAAWLRRRRAVPYVLYVHGKDLFKEERKRRSPIGRWTSRAVLGGAHAIIACSHSTAAHARAVLEALGLDDAGRVRVVHPGTDPERFHPDAAARAAWRARLGLDGRTVVLTVARLVPRKGVDLVLRAVAGVANQDTSLAYVVAGGGPERTRLEDLAAELGIAERVFFLGPVDEAELPGLYAAADIFALAAWDDRAREEVEGFGIVLCEAAAAALPTIAAASGGMGEAIRDGETGLLVPPRNVAALEAALRRLVQDPVLRHCFGAAGRRAVETYYRWDRAAAEVWRILEEVAR